MTPDRRRAELTRDESLHLAGSVPFGRIVFTSRALPAIRPVYHLRVGDQIIIRARLGAAIGAAADSSGTIVAYQADLLDPAERLGWSVVIVGRASPVADKALAARYRKSLLSWADEEMDEVVAISADLVSGFRMIPVPGGREPASGPVPVAEILVA